NQEHTGDPIPEPSNCKVRIFEMMKYSFNDDEEYITIKESEYLNHSKDILDAYRELLRLIDEGWNHMAYPIRRITLLPYAVSMKITIRRYNNKCKLGMISLID
ncbi:hypothetical protein Tco_0759780, partial [Tanacetum coccineum]